MTQPELQAILSEHLAKYRSWTYAQLAERTSNRGNVECSEGVASDGTAYQIEVNFMWDDKRGGNVHVMADLSAEPQKPLWGFLPIYRSDVADSFIMSPDGSFVGETDP